MNHQFDELTKSMAQSVTRRAALKKFGLGLTALALAASPAWPAAGAILASALSSTTDPADDAIFPYATPIAYLIDETGVIVNDLALGTDAILDLIAPVGTLSHDAREVVAPA